MAKIELSVEVSPTTNQLIMRLYDTSYYINDSAVLDNYLLEVLPVNKSSWVPFHVAPGFSLVLNSSNLRYRKASEQDELIDLPDGIYEFKQSYKPNIHTLNHFLHLRTVELSNRVQSERANLMGDKCNISREEYIVNRDKLRDVDEYIQAAKWMVEECLDKVKGKELYDWAKKLLELYTNECQC